MSSADLYARLSFVRSRWLVAALVLGAAWLMGGAGDLEHAASMEPTPVAESKTTPAIDRAAPEKTRTATFALG